ncbi:MAG: hypothetical protein K0U66_04215 [Gammaproteobacteria bacterium]|nr:hypothetical protein [Gammaproteobacteria bacterium]
MAEAKQNKTNATDGQTASQCKPDDKPQTTFAGTPVVNALPVIDGKPMLTFKVNADITPKIGDQVTITWGKIKRTGVVKRLLQNNIVAIISTN